MSRQDGVPTQTMIELPANWLILLVVVTGFEPVTCTSRITAPKEGSTQAFSRPGLRPV